MHAITEATSTPLSRAKEVAFDDQGLSSKDKHRRASSQGEKMVGLKQNRSNSKQKNKSFFESQTDERRQNKGVAINQKASLITQK
jgi:hypothetical protein